MNEVLKEREPEERNAGAFREDWLRRDTWEGVQAKGAQLNTNNLS